MAAGENHALGGEFTHEGIADVAGMDLAIHASFAHTTGNQLRDLRAEIENENFLMHDRFRVMRDDTRRSACQST